jgi:2-amino-4-hydroxy-6-hydroxymethyldihydropteridine diphosphokinase
MRAGIALGSNIGDRMENIRAAREALASLFGPVLFSPVYETDPVDCEPGSTPFLNAVAEIEWDGEPKALLEKLQEVEKKLGRPSRRPRNAPRTIDLDILYLGEMVVATEEIAIPHPRLHLRRFVLAPLCDIRPDLILPGFSEGVSSLLAKLPEKPAVRIQGQIHI